jgi:putative flippase GtrA
MKKIWNLYKKYEEIVNYLVVGGLTTIVAIGSKLLLLATILDQTNGLELQIAEVISWFLAVTFAYVTNRIFVFKSKTSGSKCAREIFNFFKGRIVTQLIQMFIMWFFVTLLKLDSNVWVLVFTLVCQVIQIVLNYVISKLLVFKK